MPESIMCPWSSTSCENVFEVLHEISSMFIFIHYQFHSCWSDVKYPFSSPFEGMLLYERMWDMLSIHMLNDRFSCICNQLHIFVTWFACQISTVKKSLIEKNGYPCQLVDRNWLDNSSWWSPQVDNWMRYSHVFMTFVIYSACYWCQNSTAKESSIVGSFFWLACELYIFFKIHVACKYEQNRYSEKGRIFQYIKPE